MFTSLILVAVKIKWTVLTTLVIAVLATNPEYSDKELENFVQLAECIEYDAEVGAYTYAYGSDAWTIDSDGIQHGPWRRGGYSDKSVRAEDIIVAWLNTSKETTDWMNANEVFYLKYSDTF